LYLDYYSSTKEIGYSLKQVHASISKLRADVIKWDDILNTLLTLDVSLGLNIEK